MSSSTIRRYAFQVIPRIEDTDTDLGKALNLGVPHPAVSVATLGAFSLFSSDELPKMLL